MISMMSGHPDEPHDGVENGALLGLNPYIKSQNNERQHSPMKIMIFLAEGLVYKRHTISRGAKGAIIFPLI